jgi:hypothetical protein
VNGFGERQASYLMRLSLEGAAQTWSRTIPDETGYEEMISLLYGRFQQQQSDLYYVKKLASEELRQEDENILVFLDRMKLISIQGKIPEDVLVVMVLKNLTKEWENRFYAHKNKTIGWSWTEIYSIGQRFWNLPVMSEKKNDIAEFETYSVKKEIQNNKGTGNHTKYCDYHEKETHSTAECYFLKKLKEKERKKKLENKKFYTGRKERKETENSKKEFNYSIFTSKKNIFYLKALIYKNIPIMVLIDTGSDINIINSKFISKNNILTQSSISMKAANNTQLQHKGICKDIQIELMGHKANISAFVSNDISVDLVLGVPYIKNEISSIDFINNGQGIKIDFLEQLKINHIQLDETEKELQRIVQEYSDLFVEEGNFKKEVCLGEHSIHTENNIPLSRAMHRLGNSMEEEINTQILELEKKGVIRKSFSPWRAPIVPVKKKDGGIRLCIDYRGLNAITKKDAYPMPRIDEIFDNLQGAKIFSTIDAYSGYYQVKVKESDIEKTAFGCRSGAYEFVRMPFGLVNGPATFQRIMDEVFRAERWKFVMVYMDDIIIFSKNKEDHAEHLKIVFNRLRKYNVALNKSKCKFCQEEIKILGHVIDKSGVRADPDRVIAISNMQIPEKLSELQSFLGLAGYCRKFVKDFAKIAIPLYDATKNKTKHEKIVFDNEMINSFEAIKKEITKNTILRLPDMQNTFILTTDASSKGIGATLSQIISGTEYPISFYSATLSQTERNYSTTDRELLAVVRSIKHYRPLLLGKKFKLNTDHQAILYLFKTHNLSARMLRWSLALQEFEFEIKYLKGYKNISDCISRLTQDTIEENVSSVKMTKKVKKENNKLIIIDPVIKKEILNEYHIKSGHGGSPTLKYLINKKFKWDSMKKEIEDFCKKCKICAQGRSIKREKNLIAIKTNTVNELWEMDTIGPLERTDSGYRYILTIIDNFSKYAYAVAMKQKTADEVQLNLDKILNAINKTPKKILMDNGLEFKNKKIIDFLKGRNIEPRFGSPYHPETQGAVERFNGTLMGKLKKMTSFGKECWKENLNNSVEAYNLSFSRVIGTSPYELTNASQPIFSIDKKLGIGLHKINDSKIVEKIRERRKKYQLEYANPVYRKNKFKVGDQVLYYDPPGYPGKLGTKWRTEGIIVEANGASYVVESPDKKLFRANEKFLQMLTGF